MDVVHQALLITTLIIFFIYRRASIFLLFYGATLIYFTPIFLGEYVYMSFYESKAEIINVQVIPYLYDLCIGILLALSVFHIFSYYSFKNKINIKNRQTIEKIKRISLQLSVVTQCLLFLQLGDVIYSDSKLDIMSNLGTLYNLKVMMTLLCFTAICLLKKPRKIEVFILVLLFSFDLFIGFRYTLIYALGVYLIVNYYNYAYRLKDVAVLLPLLFIGFSFFAMFGNIRDDLRAFDFSSILDKTSSSAWWLYNFTHFEPMSIFGIFNDTVQMELECSATKIFGSSLAASAIPFSDSVIQYTSFHDCFQPKLFPFFENIASNPWAEAYSFGGTIGVFLLLVFLLIIIFLISYIFTTDNDALKIYTILFLGIILIYFQRSDLTIILFTAKRLFLAFIVIYVITQITSKYIYKARMP